jgi:ABC-2 type transport system permease protein
MKKLLKYDFYYLLKTSKFIIFPVVLILVAITSPLSAKYLNDLLKFALEGSGIVMAFGEPTVFDSYSQYFGNIYEIYLYVIIFIAVGMFVRDKTKGLLPLVLSKPISRTKYIISKFVSLGTLILVSLFIGYLVFGYYTFFLFDEVDMLGLFYGTLLYFVYIIYILSLSMFASTHSKSYILAVVITFGGMMLFGLLALFNVGVFKFLPGLIITNIMELLTDSFVISDIIWNVVVTLIISAIFMTLSILRFKKQDI